MNVPPALIFVRDVSTSQSTPDDGSFACDKCFVVADLVTLISGSVNDQATEITVGNTEFSFSYTSLLDGGVAAASSIDAPDTM